MASSADLAAQKKGFKNYYQYRNYLAQLEGYKNYGEKRKAVAAAKALGIDLIPPAVEARAATEIKHEVARFTSEMAEVYSIPRPSTDDLQTAIDNHIERFVKQNWRGSSWLNYKPIKPVVTKEADKLAAATEKYFGDVRSPHNVTAEAYRMGIRAAGKPVIEEALDWERIDELNFPLYDRYHLIAEMSKKDSLRWDDEAKNHVGNAAEARRLAKQPVHGMVDSIGRSMSPSKYEKQFTSDFLMDAYWGGYMTGFDYFEVRDGAGCGWSYHGDPQVADGMIVDKETAEAYPQAHPYCVRQFRGLKDKDGSIKEAAKEARKAISRGHRTEVTKRAAEVATATAVVAGLLGLATTEITTSTFEGTIGDLIINSIGPRVTKAIGLAEDSMARILQVLRINPAFKGITTRLQEAAAAFKEVNPNVTDDQAQRIIADHVWNQKTLWEQTAEDNVVDLASRRALGIAGEMETLTAPERRKIVGDAMEDFDNYYRIRYHNSVSLEQSVSQLAEAFETQSAFRQALMDTVAPITGRWGRFSLPKINVLEGDVRRTHRYARLSLQPNDLIHLHTSFRPETDGSFRFIKNLKLNPNGILRLGFVQGEDGIVRPNMSLVPPGPLRVYSTFNRSKAVITRVIDGVPTEFPNPAAGRFNSVTTQIRLLARHIPLTEDFEAKFNVRLRALGIFKPSDIKDINMHKLRFMMADNKEVDNFVSSGVNFRYNLGGLFDFSRSLRVDKEGVWALRSGVRDLDEHVKTLLNYYNNMEVLHPEGPIDQINAFFMANGQFISEMRGIDPLGHRQQIEKAKKALGYKFRNVGAPPDKWASWDMARWAFDTTQKEIERRVDTFTDYLISAQREGARPTHAEVVGQKFVVPDPDQGPEGWRELVIRHSRDADEQLYLDRPNLVMSFLEADPRRIASDLKMKITDVDAIKLAVQDKISALLNQNIPFITDEFKQRMLDKIASGVPSRGWLQHVPDGDYYNNAGYLRFHALPEDIFDDEGNLLEKFTPGHKLNARDMGRPILSDDFSQAFAVTHDDSYQGDIVEFLIDGQSRQRVIDGDKLLTGNYDIVGYNRKTRRADSQLFDEDIPDRFDTLHRIYLRQTTSDGPQLNDLAVATNGMEQLPKQPHETRRLLLRNAFPVESDAVDDVMNGTFAQAAEHLGDATVEGQQAQRLVELANQSPVVPKLYKSLDLTEEEIQQITKSKKFVDEFGLWTSENPAQTGEGNAVVIATNAKAVNVSPLSSSGERTSEYFASGNFQVVNVRRIFNDDGTSKLYIFVRYLNPARKF